MSNLIVMTFDDCQEAKQIQSAIRQLQENSSLDFDATIVTKDDLSKLRTSPMTQISTPVLPQIKAQQGVASDKTSFQNVLDCLPQGNAALLMVTSEDASNTALLTMLMLYSPNAVLGMLPSVVAQSDMSEAHFRAEVETYQAAVANLDALEADSTEVDVDVVYKAVDDAYDRLAYFISASFPPVSG